MATWYTKVSGRPTKIEGDPDDPSLPAGGDCFTAAGRYVMNNGIANPNLVLVHARIRPRMGPLKNVVHWHAWVEDGDTAIDQSNGKSGDKARFPKDLYLMLADPVEVRRYSVDDFRRAAVESGHYGPWENLSSVKQASYGGGIGSLPLVRSAVEDCDSRACVEAALSEGGYPFSWVQLKDCQVIKVEDGNNPIVIDDVLYPSPVCFVEWAYRMTESSLDGHIGEFDFSSFFWGDKGGVGYVYHGTDIESVPSIMREGLRPEDRTRGLNNRGVGAAVFTTEDMEHLGETYPTVLEIDVSAMKADGLHIPVSREPEIERADKLNRLARMMGVDDFEAEGEIESGIYPTTVIFYGTIPPKYLKVLR